MISWTAHCPRCGQKQRQNRNLTLDQARLWAADWDKFHEVEGEVCSERKEGGAKET